MLFLIEKTGLTIRWIFLGAFILLSASFLWKQFLHRLKRRGYLEFLYLFLLMVFCLSLFMFLIGIVSLFIGRELREAAQSFSMWGHGITEFRLGFIIKILLLSVWLYGFIRHMSRKWNWGKKMKELYTFNEVITDQITIESFASAAMKSRIRREPMLFQNQAVSVPFLKGIIHPAVILPEKEFTPDELTLIFAHELSHFRSGDLFIRYLLELVFLIYWFIPFEDYWLEELIEIQESLCDISVCRIFGESFSAERYFSMILNISSGAAGKYKVSRNNFVNTQLLEDVGHLEKIIVNMLGQQVYRKSLIFQAAFCSAAVFLLFLFLCISMQDYSKFFHRKGEFTEIIIRRPDDMDQAKMFARSWYSEPSQYLLNWNDSEEYRLEPGESVKSAPFIGESEQRLIVCAVGNHKDYSICVEYNNAIVEIEAENETTSLNLEMEEREYVLSLVNTGEEDLKIFLYCNY